MSRTESAVARVRAAMSETRRRHEREGRFTRATETSTAPAPSAAPMTRTRADQLMTPEAASAITSAPSPTR